MLDPFFQVNTIAMWLFSIVGFNNNSLVAALYCQQLQITYWQQFQFMYCQQFQILLSTMSMSTVLAQVKQITISTINPRHCS